MFKCYTKDKTIHHQLLDFIEETPVESYDFRTALRVLETSPGFLEVATTLAKKARDGGSYVRLLLEAGDAYRALGFLKQKDLGWETRLGILLNHGGELVGVYPVDVNRLLMEIMQKHGGSLDEVQLCGILQLGAVGGGAVGGAGGIVPAVGGATSAGGSSSVGGRGAGSSEPTGGGGSLSRSSVGGGDGGVGGAQSEETVREQFLRDMVSQAHLFPQRWVETSLLPALLEHLLRKWRGHSQDQATETDLRRLLADNGTRAEFLREALTLCGASGFRDGFGFCCEKLGEFQALLAFHVENNDWERLLASLRRCGPSHPALWGQTLNLLARRKGTAMRSGGQDEEAYSSSSEQESGQTAGAGSARAVVGGGFPASSQPHPRSDLDAELDSLALDKDLEREVRNQPPALIPLDEEEAKMSIFQRSRAARGVSTTGKAKSSSTRGLRTRGPNKPSSSALQQRRTLCEQVIPELLRNASNVPLLQVLDCLRSAGEPGGVPLGAVRSYLLQNLSTAAATSTGGGSGGAAAAARGGAAAAGTIGATAGGEGEQEEGRKSQHGMDADRKEIQKMQLELHNLRTKPQIFSASKCAECGLSLECPSVHFFCMHSYHKYCVSDESAECPRCAAGGLSGGAGGAGSLLEQASLPVSLLEAVGEQQTDEFFKYLKASRHNDGGFGTVAEYLGRNLFLGVEQ